MTRVKNKYAGFDGFYAYVFMQMISLKPCLQAIFRGMQCPARPSLSRRLYGIH